MPSSILFPFYILVWTLCVFPSEASGLRRVDTSDQSQAWHPEAFFVSSFASSSSPSQSYTFSVPTPRVIEPTLASQGMTVSSIIPLYEVCNTPGLQKPSCSIVFKKIVTTTCSTVLTYAFTQATISDCGQNITFSTQSSYSIATATLTAATTATTAFQPFVTTYVQSIVSYYIAPWQSLATNRPSNVTVLVCKYDFTGASSCNTIQEIWVVYTEYVPVITTSTLIIWTTLASPAVLLLGPSESITVGAGPLFVSTEIIYSSMTPKNMTSISTILPTSTLIKTLTITSKLPAKTITLTLSSVTPTPEVTTTLTSRTVMTRTVTLQSGP